MILYYAPGTCSQACQIALNEAGLPFSLIKVSRDRKTEDGRDFNNINPKGYTPALDLGDGTILTENLVILAYIADQSGKLLAKDGLQRWRALEATAFMTTEIHRNYLPFFYPDSTPDQKDTARQALEMRFGTIDLQLGEKKYLIGEQLTIADAYLIIMLSWARMMGITVSKRLGDYLTRMKKLPSVVKTIGE